MKRKYQKPTAALIDYAYDEQIVAASSYFNGWGDGKQTGYCTYQSGWVANPCRDIVNTQYASFCQVQPWSL